jgi:hypothetical protein
MTSYRYIVFAILMTSLLNGGCAANVKPWERGELAKEYMAVEPDSLRRTINEQVVTSKEASSGGYAVAGGGCGCN